MKTLYEKALEYESTGDFCKAYELLLQCLAQNDHDSAETAFQCGWCIENSANSDRQRAIQFYNMAAEKAAAPELKGNASFRAGWILLQEKAPEQAAAAFKKAICLAESNPNNPHLYHHALFWYAASLEHLGRYLEAIQCHDIVTRCSPELSPESIYRKIICHNQVGNYEAALEECKSFPGRCQPGFDSSRYLEIRELIKKEEHLLLQCLNQEYLPGERC